MDYFVKGLAHIGIYTDDAKRCAEFYIENLGFRQFYEACLGDTVLSFVECGGCVLEFVQRGTVEENGKVDHIAIEVQGIEALVEKLKAKGVKFETDTINKMPGLFPDGSKCIFFKGPAGERVEIFDYTK